MFVNEPSFSVCVAAGRKKTSTGVVSGDISPVSTSGPSCQKDADSIIWRSRTTSHLRLAIPSRCSLELAEPTAGFWPMTKNPSTLPSFMSMTAG